MKSKQDSSYGIVPLYNDDGAWQVLLVHQISYRGDDFWVFPKGHANQNESPMAAALRELEEETGVTKVTLLPKPPITILYSFLHEGVLIEKTVEYFVGVCASKDTSISQPNEIKEVCWCSVEDAMAKLTHQNSKDILTTVITTYVS